MTACVLDHDDITTLAFSIEGLKRVHGPRRGRLRSTARCCRPACPTRWSTCASSGTPCAQLRRPVDRPVQPALLPLVRPGPAEPGSSLISAAIAGPCAGWIKVVLGQGGDDPWAVVRARMREVLLRTDLWSDQVLVLRAVQTLTMLDVQHNCDLVWSLGGYTHLASDPACGDGPPPASFASALPAHEEFAATLPIGK